MIQVTWIGEAYTWHNWDACWKVFYINNFSLLRAWIAKYWDCLSFMWSVFDLDIKYLFLNDRTYMVIQTTHYADHLNINDFKIYDYSRVFLMTLLCDENWET